MTKDDKPKMGRPRRSDGLSTARITLHCTPDERETLQTVAERDEKTLSTWIVETSLKAAKRRRG